MPRLIVLGSDWVLNTILGAANVLFIASYAASLALIFLCFHLTQPVTGESINYAAPATATVVLAFVPAYLFHGRKNYQLPHSLLTQD
ncbi:hypothetical protein B0T24DRAFT_677851 [Lasiosphaeria ovina]|uniref:Uncharacterized protein n=1 Tax=Lasiosphaeria ovina TaxID=92902 RepID=A0AAE0KJ91_9PEZI|nr:hypothetical protein B0T24DRAFT_677851 [Lasiosphaeria ovina]